MRNNSVLGNAFSGVFVTVLSQYVLHFVAPQLYSIMVETLKCFVFSTVRIVTVIFITTWLSSF